MSATSREMPDIPGEGKLLPTGTLRRAVGDDQKQEFCYACYTGAYPTELVHIEDLLASKPKRF